MSYSLRPWFGYVPQGDVHVEFDTPEMALEAIARGEAVERVPRQIEALKALAELRLLELAHERSRVGSR